jgi:hypothetical protein
MKAEHLKKHLKKVAIEEQEDSWGDKFWVVEGRKYFTKQEAQAAVSKLVEDEFRDRYLKEKK